MTAPVTVIGLDDRALPDSALAALARAKLVAGGARHLDAVRHLLPPVARTVAIGGDIPTVLDELAAEPGPAVVLASGDPGFFGILRAVAERFPAPAVLPAVSSVSAAFARAGMSWDDARVVSAHGRTYHRAVAVCRRFDKVAVLTEPSFGPAQLGAALRGLGKHFVVAERLGQTDERVTALPADAADDAAAAHREWRDPNIVVVHDGPRPARGKGWAAPPRTTPATWALPDDAFDHRGGMITKAEVRALALAWLGPGVGDLVWDVGTGSGSVAVECARLGAAVIAVDSDDEQCEAAEANAARHGVPLEVRLGAAPAALTGLPDPDAVFVGGGGDALPAILSTAADRARRAVVVTLASVDRVAPALALLGAAGLSVDGTQLHAARLRQLAGGQRLAAVNPVFVLRGTRP